MSYRIFWRTWWIENPAWPNGLEPGAGRRHYVRGVLASTVDEAVALCRQYQREHHFSAEQRRLSAKYEFEEACEMISAARDKRDAYCIRIDGVRSGISYKLHYHTPFLEQPSFPEKYVRITRCDGTEFEKNAGSVRQDSGGAWQYRAIWDKFWSEKRFDRREDAAAALLVLCYRRRAWRTE